ncbi:MAG: type IX secretion system sortase PorU [Bacteroidota bacterium]
MKNYFFILFCFFFQLGFSQTSDHVELMWKEDVYKFNEKYSFRVPYFQAEYFNYDGGNNSVKFQKSIPLSGVADEKSLEVSNLQFETVSVEKLGVLNLKNVAKTVNFKIENIFSRDKNNLLLTFSPIILDKGVYKRVKSFDYNFKLSNESVINSYSNRRAVVSSVLKNGTWKKFYIQKSGVYRISKSFLSQLGVNVNVDPRTIKIYGNGGRMLPLVNSVSYPNDLEENAIQIIGENDGIFNDSDYVLFYAQGVEGWNEESQTHINQYADKTYYYVTTGGVNGKRIVDMVEPAGTPDATYSVFDDYQYHEKDNLNIVKLGRKWFGEQFNIQNNQSYQFNFPNIDLASPVAISVRGAGASVVDTFIKVKLNGSDSGFLNFAAINSGSAVFADEGSFNGNITSANSTITVGLTYDNNGVPSSNAYLDFIKVKAKSQLKGFNKQFHFSVDEVASNIGICEYQFANATSIGQVWNITDIYNVLTKTNTGQAAFAFKDVMGSAKKYIAVDNTDFLTPFRDSNASVVNQDLKGEIFLDGNGVFQDIDYVIVTPAFLVTQAERLANFHRSYSNLNVKVVTLNKIYEEFSSGKQDIGAIRNFIKYVYQNSSAPDKKLKYVCLFGDASFDFKDRILNNTNIVPVFQSLESYTLFSSFVSDDYFGLMDPAEGNIVGSQGLDIAVGRILCSDVAIAEQMVTKIIDYHDDKSYGRWRNNLLFLSDDVDATSDATLQENLDSMADAITNDKPFFNVKKIHTDAFVQETTSGGQKYPKAKEEFLNAFSQGTLVMDYIGHGSEDGLAAERLFEISDANQLSNRYKYPLFITVTCEFTRFDNPLRPTGGELTFTNPTGGAIALITTTRQIGQSTGENFNTLLAPILFSFGSNNYVSIAEAVRLVKTSYLSSGNNVVSFIGDPAMKLAIPRPKIRLTKINDIPVSSFTGSLEALAKVKLSGEVTDEFDALQSNYNGELFVNIFDKDVSKTTLGNDNTMVGGTVYKMNFNASGETIFRGNASVQNGMFELSFVVPKDIRIPLGNGKISFYSKKNDVKEDNAGYDLSVKVGGVNTNAVADTTPPRVRLYMNDESFVSGGITNQSPLFLAFVEDENGMNTASGIGHDIVVYLDGDETKPIPLNDYYETEKDDYTKGKVSYPFRNLSPGLHTLTFKIWDVYNNITVSELQFIVIDDSELKLTNVLNYPNPFVNHTEFWFTHNKPFEPLDVQVQVLTITGRVVWSKSQTITNEGFTSRDITWNGKDDFGDKIGKGVYVYRLTVKSTLTNKKAEKFEKLVIL